MKKRVLVHYKANITHLDAGTSGKNLPKDWVRKNAILQVALPYRISYQIAKKKREKLLCLCSCVLKYVEQAMFTTIIYLLKERKWVLGEYIGGLKDGVSYIHSNEYLKVPRFDAYKR